MDSTDPEIAAENSMASQALLPDDPRREDNCPQQR